MLSMAPSSKPRVVTVRLATWPRFGMNLLTESNDRLYRYSDLLA